MAFGSDNTFALQLVFHDLTAAQAQEALKPFLDFVAAAMSDYEVVDRVNIAALPARHWWDPVSFAKNFPSVLEHDPRHGEPAANVWYPGDGGQAGWFIHGYESAWLPATMLDKDRRGKLNDIAVRRKPAVALRVALQQGAGGRLRMRSPRRATRR